MDRKISLLMNLALIVANCQLTISQGNDDTSFEQELLDDMKSEMESMRQLLIDIKLAAVRREAQAMQQKSEIDKIRQTVLKQQGNETQAMQEMKCKIEDIKSEMGSIRQLLVNLQQAAVRNDNQMMEEIRKISRKQHDNETQALQEMKSEIEEIRQIVIQEQTWSRIVQRRTACPLGFDYLPEAGSCFTFIAEKMTWDDATARCRGIMSGAHLAAITNQEEQDAIARYLPLQFSKNGIASPSNTDWFVNAVWTSGQRSNPGRCDTPFVWKTLNGINIPFNFTRWATGEPNCGDGPEFCAHIWPGMGHKWNDDPCGNLFFSLCEI